MYARITFVESDAFHLETPALFPVHNLGKKGAGNSPNYWENIPDMKNMLINIHAIRTSPIYHKLLEGGLKSIYSPKMAFFVDSGGFQNRNAEQQPDPIEVLRIQETIGTNIASTLDIPIFTDTHALTTQHQKFTSISIKNAILASKNKKDENMKLYASVQGYSKTHLLNFIDYLMKHGDFDGFALGGLLSKRTRFFEIIDIITAVRQKIGDKQLHIFGMGGPTTIPLMIYAGADSCDSSSYMKAGSKRIYYYPGKGSIKFSELPDETPYLPCVCPICSTHTTNEVRDSRKLIAMHNLWMLTQELRIIKQHIREGDYESYLETRFAHNPLAYDAFRYAKLKTRRLI